MILKLKAGNNECRSEKMKLIGNFGFCDLNFEIIEMGVKK
jgi:hypothetical protein